MSFFEFIKDVPLYDGDPKAVRRLNKRRDFIVTPFRDEIKDARVLDLAAHDGRWSYALSEAGAKFVHGIEGRQNLVDTFQHYPKDAHSAKVKLEVGDVFDALARMNEKSRRFDVIACFGFFYHITDHYRLLTMLHQMKPKLIIMDSEFMMAQSPIVTFGREKSEKNLNTIARVPGQDVVMVGTPSRRWLWSAAETLGYTLDWVDWKALKAKDRDGVSDYYRQGPKRRGTVALRPKASQ